MNTALSWSILRLDQLRERELAFVILRQEDLVKSDHSQAAASCVGWGKQGFVGGSFAGRFLNGAKCPS